jgi:hypothetical protein
VYPKKCQPKLGVDYLFVQICFDDHDGKCESPVKGAGIDTVQQDYFRSIATCMLLLLYHGLHGLRLMF